MRAIFFILLSMHSLHCISQDTIDKAVVVFLPKFDNEKRLVKLNLLNNSEIPFDKITGIDLQLIKQYTENREYIVILQKSNSITIDNSNRELQFKINNFGENYINPSFEKQFSILGDYPAGKYYYVINIYIDTLVLNYEYYVYSDSFISDHKLIQAIKTQFFNSVKAKVKTKKNEKNSLFKKSGITFHKTAPGRNEMYIDNDFVGIIEENASVNKYANFEESLSKPILQQIKDLLNDTTDVSTHGEIGINYLFNYGEQNYSDMNNNIVEVTNQLSFPVWGIPVNFQGYFTTQDFNRKIMASNFKFSYDKQKFEERITKITTLIKQEYEERQNLLQNYADLKKDQLLKNNKSLQNTYNDIQREIGQDPLTLVQSLRSNSKEQIIQELTDIVAQKMRQKLDKKMMEMKDSIAKQTELKKEYDKIKEQSKIVAEKIYKYYELYQKGMAIKNSLKTYLANAKLDSLYNNKVVLEQLKDKNISFETAANIVNDYVPVNKYLARVNEFDIGFFNTKLNKYTINGQMLKGGNFSYNFGKLKTTLTGGRSEYISRSGDKETYNIGSMNIGYQFSSDNEVSIGYTGLLPNMSNITSENFLNYNTYKKTAYNKLINIYSLNAKFTPIKNSSINLEYAFSHLPQKGQYSFNNNEGISNIANASSLLCQLEYQIPFLRMHLNADYERIGRDFENHSLPINMVGMEKVSVGSKFSLLSSKLNLKIGFVQVTQSNYSMVGSNKKVEFEVKTRFRKLPNIHLSYKPFSSFRKVTDTFTIPQREMIGSILMGRIQYFYKNDAYLINSSILYTANVSNNTVYTYKNYLLQGMIAVMAKRYSISLSGGSNSNTSNDTLVQNPYLENNKFNFVNIIGNYSLNTKLNIGGGTNISFNKYEIQRLGFNLNTNYKFSKNTTLLLNCSYFSTKDKSLQKNNHNFFGNLGISYRFDKNS